MHELLERISKESLAEELKILNKSYPYPKTDDDMKIVVTDYYSQFKTFNEKKFLKAIKRYKKSDLARFPTAYELRYYYNQILRQEKFLKEHTERMYPVPEITPEQLEKRKRIWKETKQKILER